MKALTICQPYAELILRGEKLVENRKWNTMFRGPLLLHAGKSRAWLDLSEDKQRDETYDIALSEMPFGFIVGVCEVVACVPKEYVRLAERDGSTNGFASSVIQEFPWLATHRHAEGPFCWILSGVRRFETPIKYAGALGLFNVPDELVLEEMQKVPA